MAMKTRTAMADETDATCHSHTLGPLTAAKCVLQTLLNTVPNTNQNQSSRSGILRHMKLRQGPSNHSYLPTVDQVMFSFYKSSSGCLNLNQIRENVCSGCLEIP
jgi:hypothetical protein